MKNWTTEKLARVIAYWHGTHVYASKDGESASVASVRMMRKPTGFPYVYDEYAAKHWGEYIHAARAIKERLQNEQAELSARTGSPAGGDSGQGLAGARPGTVVRDVFE